MTEDELKATLLLLGFEYIAPDTYWELGYRRGGRPWLLRMAFQDRNNKVSADGELTFARIPDGCVALDGRLDIFNRVEKVVPLDNVLLEVATLLERIQ